MMSGIYSKPWSIPPFNIIEGSDYIEPFNKIIFAHKEIWKNPQFKHYTKHGKEHVENILSFMSEWLKGTTNFKELEGSEEAAQASLFILLGAIYLHDIGMQCCHGEFQIKYLGEELSKYKNGPNNWRNLEKIREHHQLLSYLMIMDSQKPIQRERDYPIEDFELGVLGLQREMEAIALLSASHTDIDITSTNNFLYKIKEDLQGKISEIEKGNREYTEYEVKIGVKTNLKRLMIILRIGDASDATSNRIDLKRFNEEKVWERLFSSRDPLALKFLFHILKHYFVESVNIDENYNIDFSYKFPIEFENEKITDYLVQIAEDPLKRNLNLYQRKGTLPLPRLKPGSQKFDRFKPNLLEDIKNSLSQDEGVKLSKLIEIQAKNMTSTDLRDSMRTAKNKIWIIGQNLRFIADPSRSTNGVRGKDEFYKRFFQKLNDEKNFEIMMLIYNPNERWNQIKDWHNKLIRTWLAQSEDERGEHRPYPPDFLQDLEFSFKRFEKWQKDLSCFRNRFLVKCHTPEKGFRSKNLIDPDYPLGLLQITQGADGTHPDPLSRGSEQIVIPSDTDFFMKEVNQCKEYLDRAPIIEEIKNVDWDKLSSYVIDTDLVKEICESLGETDKIQRYLDEKISKLQSIISRISTDDQHYTKLIGKKEKLEGILNKFLFS